MKNIIQNTFSIYINIIILLYYLCHLYIYLFANKIILTDLNLFNFLINHN
jgi:hypothetical protein